RRAKAPPSRGCEGGAGSLRSGGYKPLRSGMMPHQFEMVRAAIVKVVVTEIVLGDVPEIMASRVLIAGALVAPTLVVSLVVSLVAVARGSFMTAAATRIAGGGSLSTLLA